MCRKVAKLGQIGILARNIHLASTVDRKKIPNDRASLGIFYSSGNLPEHISINIST